MAGPAPRWTSEKFVRKPRLVTGGGGGGGGGAVGGVGGRGVRGAEGQVRLLLRGQLTLRRRCRARTHTHLIGAGTKYIGTPFVWSRHPQSHLSLSLFYLSLTLSLFLPILSLSLSHSLYSISFPLSLSLSIYISLSFSLSISLYFSLSSFFPLCLSASLSSSLYSLASILLSIVHPCPDEKERERANFGGGGTFYSGGGSDLLCGGVREKKREVGKRERAREREGGETFSTFPLFFILQHCPDICARAFI